MPALTAEEVRKALEDLPGCESDGASIGRKFTFASYMEGVGFATKVAEAADRADHHPDILIGYRAVTVTLTSHDSGGVTGRDLSLAREAQALATP